MTVQLYLTDIRPLFEQETALLPLLTKKRREQVDALQNPTDRLHGIAAGLLLRRVLGVGNSDIAYSNHGKPHLIHRDVHFNLSHGGDYAVLAVGTQELGVDIEQIPQQVNAALIKKVFHDDERQWLALDPTPERFALLWTRLESALKASGTGFGGTDRAYSLVRDDCPYRFQTLTHDRHIITVAAEEAFTAETHILSPEELLG